MIEEMAAPTKAGLRSLARLETHSENVHRNPQQSITNYLATIAQYNGIEIMNGPDLGGFGGWSEIGAGLSRNEDRLRFYKNFDFNNMKDL